MTSLDKPLRGGREEGVGQKGSESVREEGRAKERGSEGGSISPLAPVQVTRLKSLGQRARLAIRTSALLVAGLP